jgi:diguanylate cyclase (GGDEF)-like protein
MKPVHELAGWSWRIAVSLAALALAYAYSLHAAPHNGAFGGYDLAIVISAALCGWGGAALSALLAAAACVGAPAARHATAARLGIELPLFFICGAVVAGLRRGAATVDQLVYCDPLTGLPGDVLLRERFEDELSRAAGGGSPLALLYLDIDRLDQLNHRVGRDGGDAALRATAGAVRGAIHILDVPARLAEDEFAVLLPDTEAHGAALAAERIRRAVAARAAGLSLHFTVSVGVVAIDPGYGRSSAETYLAQAAAALFEARRTGRDRVVFYDAEMYGR